MLTKGELQEALMPFTDELEIVVYHNQQQRTFRVLDMKYALEKGYGKLYLRIGDKYEPVDA